MFTKIVRPDRSRRISAIFLTIFGGLLAAAIVAGMIYFSYTTRRF